jgi:hypothetical protein
MSQCGLKVEAINKTEVAFIPHQGDLRGLQESGVGQEKNEIFL